LSPKGTTGALGVKKMKNEQKLEEAQRSTRRNKMRVCNERSKNELNVNAQRFGTKGKKRTKLEGVQILKPIFEIFAFQFLAHFQQRVFSG